MIVLSIILSVLAVIILLLLIPLKMDFRFSDLSEESAPNESDSQEIFFQISYLFFKFPFFFNQSAEEKEEENGKDKAEEGTDTGDFSKKKLLAFYRKKGLKGFLVFVKEVMKILTSSALKLLKHVKVKELDIYAVAGGEDAASTAVLYGEACAVLYPAAGFVKELCRCKTIGVSVDANYNRKSSAVRCICRVSILPIWILVDGLALIYKLLPYLKDFKE